MQRFRSPVAVPALVLVLSAACGSSSSSATVTATEVVVRSDSMEATYARKAELHETFMIFGGAGPGSASTFSDVMISGLGMTDARPIYRDHPDFHLCKSPGARAAQNATRQLDVVTADAGVLAVLERALAESDANLRNGGDRVCVELVGDELEMTAATADGHDVMTQLPKPLRAGRVLVRSARIVDAREALGGPMAR